MSVVNSYTVTANTPLVLTSPTSISSWLSCKIDNLTTGSLTISLKADTLTIPQLTSGTIVNPGMLASFTVTPDVTGSIKVTWNLPGDPVLTLVPISATDVNVGGTINLAAGTSVDVTNTVQMNVASSSVTLPVTGAVTAELASGSTVEITTSPTSPPIFNLAAGAAVDATLAAGTSIDINNVTGGTIDVQNVTNTALTTGSDQAILYSASINLQALDTQVAALTPIAWWKENAGGSPTATITVGTNPLGVAYGNGYVYVANYSSNTVSVLALLLPDSSGNGFNLTNNGLTLGEPSIIPTTAATSAYGNGAYNNVPVFAGVTMTGTLLAAFQNHDFSVVGHFLATGAQAQGRGGLCSANGNSPFTNLENIIISLWNNSTEITFQSIGGTILSSAPIDFNKFYQYGFIYHDATQTVDCYLNGVPIASGIAVGGHINVPSGSVLRVGGDYAGGSLLGYTQETIVFDIALTAAQVASLWQGASGIIATIPAADIPPTASVPSPAHAIAWSTDLTLTQGLGSAVTSWQPELYDSSGRIILAPLSPYAYPGQFTEEVDPNGFINAGLELLVGLAIEGGASPTWTLSGTIAIVAYTSSIPPRQNVGLQIDKYLAPIEWTVPDGTDFVLGDLTTLVGGAIIAPANSWTNVWTASVGVLCKQLSLIYTGATNLSAWRVLRANGSILMLTPNMNSYAGLVLFFEYPFVMYPGDILQLAVNSANTQGFWSLSGVNL